MIDGGIGLDVEVTPCADGDKVAAGAALGTPVALVDEVEHLLRASGRGGNHQRSRGEDTP